MPGTVRRRSGAGWHCAHHDARTPRSIACRCPCHCRQPGGRLRWLGQRPRALCRCDVGGVRNLRLWQLHISEPGGAGCRLGTLHPVRSKRHRTAELRLWVANDCWCFTGRGRALLHTNHHQRRSIRQHPHRVVEIDLARRIHDTGLPPPVAIDRFCRCATAPGQGRVCSGCRLRPNTALFADSLTLAGGAHGHAFHNLSARICNDDSVWRLLTDCVNRHHTAFDMA